MSLITRSRASRTRSQPQGPDSGGDPPALEVDHVSASYGPYRALFDVSFSVPAGGVTALIGSNGAGKSTVSRVVTGLLASTAGAIRLGGRDITGLAAYKIARAGTAHVPEGRGVFASLTVEENLRLVFRQRGGRQCVPDALARAYEAFPVLGERRRQHGGTLSGGEQRMLSLAKVLVLPPSLLVADEISLGLAPVVIDVVYEGLRQINRAGTAVLVVEQQVDRVLDLAGTAVVLEHGSVAYQGPSDGALAAIEKVMSARGEPIEDDPFRAPTPTGPPRSSRKAFGPPALRQGPRRPGEWDADRSGSKGAGMNTDQRDAVIVDVVRTTMGKRGGALANWHPADLLGFALTSLVERTGIDPGQVDDVIGGCVTQRGEQSTNVTRNGWVSAGLPQSVPATTVDRQCGSSQQAMHFAAAGVKAGHYDLVVACGVESMSRVPLASNARGGTGPFPPSFLEQIDGRLWAQFRVAQVLADRWDISREEMDAYSLESHRRAAAAWDAGLFAHEAVPVPLKDEDGTFSGSLLEADEGIRRSGSMESMAGLPPAQSWEQDTAPDITAGNSSQMTDGAAAMLIADRALAERLGLPIRARFAHATVAADDAAIVLSAPVPATQRLLERSGMKIEQFEAIECNEAFAAIPLMWNRAFSADPEVLNPNGGAIAIGHPLGASGVRLAATLLNRLESIGGRYGFQTMCEGGGQANATVIERLS